MKKKHTIHKVFIELNTKSKTQAYEIKDNISSFLSSEVFPSLEKQLDSLDSKSASYAVQIDKLTLDISEKTIRLNSGLKERIISSFKEKIEAIEQEDNKEIRKLKKQFKTLNKEDHYLNTFTYFLKNGTTPWWNTNESISFLFTPVVLNKIIATPAFAKQFSAIIHITEVQERFINQFTDTDIHKICTVIGSQQKTTINLNSKTLHKIAALNTLERKIVWTFIIRSLIAKQVIDNNLINYVLNKQTLSSLLKEEYTTISSEERDEKKPFVINKTMALDNTESPSVSNTIEINKKDSLKPINDTDATKNNLKQIIKSVIKKDKKDIDTIAENNTPNDSEGCYINNAGLVLAHPFLKHFFTHCKLLDSNNKLSNPELCVHLLHYIATGKTQQAESDMVFEKFLCDIPVTQSINRHVIITDEHKNQADQLLNAINANWPAMKKSTTALLQYEFLQRPGKMVYKNENTTITVEHKTQDIIFNTLSWNIGLIKLPWKADLMYANW
ncbi:MAG: hypothetical protein HRT69_03570 [Flavobacteriaceae bacterium]|nr:hypothetical protein [Flavobacteriaceae bacterium]